MAYANKAHLTILYPYRLISYVYKEDISNLKLKLVEDAQQKFRLLQQQVETLNHIFFEFHPEIGFAVDRINAYVRQHKVDRIVIGEGQANSINDIDIKPVQNLLANSNTPFTIVPPEINAPLSSY